MPGLEALDTADLMVIFLRFQNFPDDQMKHISDYLDRAGPVVGLRTATHAFKIPRTSTYARFDTNYPGAEFTRGFGRQVLGETWAGHYGKNHAMSTRLDLVPDQKAHPVLRGVSRPWVQAGAVLDRSDAGQHGARDGEAAQRHDAGIQGRRGQEAVSGRLGALVS